MAAEQDQPTGQMRHRNKGGEVSDLVRRNIKQLREERGMSTNDLAERMKSFGRPIQATAITRVESGERRVDVGDLVAFALALQVTPNRLLLPTDRGDEERYRFVPWIGYDEKALWAWAMGEMVLWAEPRELEEEEDVAGQVNAFMLAAVDDFRRHSLPADRRLGEELPAVAATERLLNQMRRVAHRFREGREVDPKTVPWESLTFGASRVIKATLDWMEFAIRAEDGKGAELPVLLTTEADLIAAQKILATMIRRAFEAREAERQKEDPDGLDAAFNRVRDKPPYS